MPPEKPQSLQAWGLFVSLLILYRPLQYAILQLLPVHDLVSSPLIPGSPLLIALAMSSFSSSS